MDSHFRRKITFILLSRDHYVYTVRQIIQYDDQLIDEQEIPDEAASASTNMSSAIKDAQIEEKSRNFWLKLMEKNYNLVRNLTLMKLQGIKEKELMKNKFSSPSNHNSYQDDYEEITDDENENNDDSNLNHQNAVY